MPSRLSVLSEGSSSPTCAGSGICLTQTITFMAAHCYRRPAVSPNPCPVVAHPGAEQAAGTVVPLAHRAGRELLRVVGHGPQHGRRAPAAEPGPRRRARRDQPPRPRHPLRPRRRPARRRRGRSASAATARVNEVATGIAGSDTALGVLPGGSTNVFARTIGLPNDPVAAAELRRQRHRRRRLPPDRAGPGQRAVLLLQHRRRLRRRRRRGGREARHVEALVRPPAVHHRRADDVGPRLRPQAPPLPGQDRPSARSRTATSRS